MLKLILKYLLVEYFLSVVLGIIATIIIYHPNPNTHDGGQQILILIVATFYTNLLLTFSALTILLNTFISFRSSWLNRVTSFYLLPVSFSIFFIFILFNETYFVATVCCFFLVHSYIFYRFNKHIRNKIEQK
jgi:hypothetical protein